MFSIGASVGELGGAAIMKKVKYNQVFFIVGPIAVIIVVCFFVTMTRLTPAKIVKFFKNRNSRTSNNRNCCKEFLQKAATVDWIGAFLIISGVGTLAIGVSMVFVKIFMCALNSARLRSGDGRMQRLYVARLLVASFS